MQCTTAHQSSATHLPCVRARPRPRLGFFRIFREEWESLGALLYEIENVADMFFDDDLSMLRREKGWNILVMLTIKKTKTSYLGNIGFIHTTNRT